MLAVLNHLQVKTLASLKPFERWTKRIQWENYATHDLHIKPLDPRVERRMAELEAKGREYLH